jgi:hypothetical protein
MKLCSLEIVFFLSKFYSCLHRFLQNCSQWLDEELKFSKEVYRRIAATQVTRS